jgi:hypothetical protein
MTRLTVAMTAVPARARVFAVLGPPPDHNAATTATAMTFVTAATVRTVHRVINTSGAPSMNQRRTYAPWGYFRNRLESPARAGWALRTTHYPIGRLVDKKINILTVADQHTRYPPGCHGLLSTQGQGVRPI